jgi:hypothetical protein
MRLAWSTKKWANGSSPWNCLHVFERSKEDTVQHLEDPWCVTRERDYFDTVRPQQCNYVGSQMCRTIIAWFSDCPGHGECSPWTKQLNIPKVSFFLSMRSGVLDPSARESLSLPSPNLSNNRLRSPRGKVPTPATLTLIAMPVLSSTLKETAKAKVASLSPDWEWRWSLREDHWNQSHPVEPWWHRPWFSDR